MSMRYLTRINPHANMACYYKLDVQPDLFGGFSLVAEWGRIGQSGQVRHRSYSTISEAEAASTQQWYAKSGRGYIICNSRSLS